MSDTPKLAMPEISEAQSGKYATHNEALRVVDALCQCTVIDKDLTTPPGSPVDGNTYIVAASATGGWSGHDTEIAYYQSTAWVFHAPEEGWMAYVQDENQVYIFGGVSWAIFAGGGGTTYDEFVDLVDTPASYSGQTGKLVRVNATATALTFDTLSFTELEDTPGGFTAGYAARCNAGGTAIEFKPFAVPVDAFFVGHPTQGQYVFYYTATRAFTIPSNFGGSRAGCRVPVASPGAAVFWLGIDGAPEVSITFSQYQNTGVWGSHPSSTLVTVGSTIYIVAPTPIDGTIADLSFNIYATLT